MKNKAPEEILNDMYNNRDPNHSYHRAPTLADVDLSNVIRKDGNLYYDQQSVPFWKRFI